MTKMKTSIKASLIATAIAMLPLGSHAAGLGSIHVFSGIGQPLKAEVELSASGEELQSLTARVAPPDAFRQANLQYAPMLSALRFAVERRGNRSVVKITSDKPINEPFVDLLIELQWAAGRLVREYTFLLDPVPAGTPAPSAAPAAPAAPAATMPARPAVSPAAAAPAPRPAPSANGQVAAAAEGRRHEIKKGDTLHRIADANRPEGVSLDQMLVALFRENQDAFEGNNINRLRAGAIITVPPESAIHAVDPVQARREVLAQAADFDSYRRKLAGTVAARPAAAEEAPSRSGGGAIVPKVADQGRAASGDQVKVSGAPGERAKPAGDDNARLARLQALEEELAARDKALEEANNRVAALEASVKQMQQLLNLRSDNMAQLQQQAAEAAPAQTPSPAAPAHEPAPAQPKEAAAPAPVPKAVPKTPEPPVEEPGFLQGLVADPAVLAGGGGILALLLAYVGLKSRQRRQQARDGMSPDVSELPPVTNSVFGATGGQSVNTGESSVLHTDFSQSGLSAIDTDEGVDPVAEADVYMAYGRDAQAEEILLDALKTDPSRVAIYLKLLEIYSQRKNLKAFESTATDLYSRTGGEGGDWDKAAEMGRRLDPENPLYRGTAEVGLPSAPRTAGFAAAAAAVGAGAALATEADELPDLGLSSSPAPVTPYVPEPIPASATPEVDIEALPEVDASALDFDLDAGLNLGLDEAGEVSAPGTESIEVDIPASAAPAFEVDLGLGPDVEELAASEPAPAPADDSMHATVVAPGLNFPAEDQALEFDLGAEMNIGEMPSLEAESLDKTVIEPDVAVSPVEPPGSPDLEKTAFDSSLLDFDFNLDDSVAKTAAPALDLADIDLNLDATSVAPAAPMSLQTDTAIGGDLDLSVPEPDGMGATPGNDVIDEVNTKLELARAYEEMGDTEGARELIEEVLREGSPEQCEAARKLAERLG